jgi:hypothetical protein
MRLVDVVQEGRLAGAGTSYDDGQCHAAVVVAVVGGGGWYRCCG